MVLSVARGEMPQSTSLVAGDGRLIAVAIGDVEEDAAVLAWAAFDAAAGVGSVHVVHSYVPLHFADCTWAPVSRARDQRRNVAQRTAACAVHRLRALRPTLSVDGSFAGAYAPPRCRHCSLPGVVDIA